MHSVVVCKTVMQLSHFGVSKNIGQRGGGESCHTMHHQHHLTDQQQKGWLRDLWGWHPRKDRAAIVRGGKTLRVWNFLFYVVLSRVHYSVYPEMKIFILRNERISYYIGQP